MPPKATKATKPTSTPPTPPTQPTATIISNQSSKINLAKTPYASLSHLIPPITNQTLVVQFKHASCELVNAIRRTLVSEMPIKHLTASLVDIKTTDPYIIAEAILKRLEMIPVAQSIREDAVFAVRAENKENHHADVMSTEIKLNGVAATKDITPLIPICDINSGCSFSINDITVKQSYGHANARVVIGRVAYEILDQDFNEPSTIAKPTHFQLEIETPGIINPKEMLLVAILNLVTRFDAIDLEKSFAAEFNMIKLKIANETHSVGRLLCRYIYQLEPTVGYVACRTPHQSKRECIIDIRHNDAIRLCRLAIDAIKRDFMAIQKDLSD